jgi:hypothetical protein
MTAPTSLPSTGNAPSRSIAPNTGFQLRFLPLVAIFFILALLIGAFFAWQLMNAPSKIMQEMRGLGRAFAPTINYKTEITGAISKLNSNPKLVVLTTTIDAEVRKTKSTSAMKIYWGTTTVRLRARENKVQFYVPMQNLGTDRFQYDDVHKTLTVYVDEPLLDTDMIDVQSDPNKIELETSNGWAKMDRFSGAPLREEAKADLRFAVIQAVKQPAQNELLQLKAQANAKEHIKKLLRTSLTNLNPDVKIEVEFLNQNKPDAKQNP